jgi:hypothetical protein
MKNRTDQSKYGAGVSRRVRRGGSIRYEVHLGKQYIGVFKTAEEAIFAREEAEKCSRNQ